VRLSLNRLSAPPSGAQLPSECQTRLMRVRIIKHLPQQLEGINLARFELDGVYEAGGAVLDLLIISGYAIPADDEIKPSRKEAIKVLANAQIADATPHADDVKSHAKPGVLTSKQTLRKDRPRKNSALRSRISPKRQKH
jgi:hypothetical protein